MIGQRISGRYEVLETIGGGGMANVYKARDIILDRLVAVKVLQPQFSKDEQFIRRFRREAQAATSLAHPNVVSIYDVGEDDNTYFIVMEYVEGKTLKELIKEKGPLSVEEALDYMEQMLGAIAHAHANHIIHRDIKPHNILIRHDGVVKVTDFGIARAISSATITHTNSIVGSVHYLSPEQARGGHVTYKSDIYSLGIVLYEMVTGALPFNGDTAVSIAIKHLQSEIPSAKKLNPSLPQSVENIIRKATCKDPLKRYGSVHEMIEDVMTALHPERRDEPPFIEKEDDDEDTKVIPIVRDFDVDDDFDKTIVPEKNNEENSTKKKKKRNWLLLIAIAIVLFFSSMIAAFTILPALFKVDEVEVPDVIEKPFEEAEEELSALGLTVEREDVEHDEIPADHVVRQNPEPGTVVKENATVLLFVSKGKEEIELDNYIGMAIGKAESLLRDLQIDVEKIPEETSDVDPGIVIAQEPKQGEKVVANESTVTLTYSVEPEIRLTNLVGLDENSVRQYLQNERLRGNFVREFSDNVPEGHVIRQTPEPNTSLKEGDLVTVVLSRGQKPKKQPPPQQQQIPTRLYEVNQEIFVSEEDEREGKTFAIRIVYRDFDTNGEDRVFVEETISATKVYTIPLRVSPSQPGSFEVYVNGELAHRSRNYTY